MKYLKYFESVNRHLYKKGDYIILNDKVINKNALSDIYENIGVIVSQKKHVNGTYMYDVDYLNDNFELNNIFDHYVLESEIIKKLTKNEINKLNAHIYSIKYNI